jgi:hypothetical protein
MIIETKFNIGDTVYYGDETSYEKGKVDDIRIEFYFNNHYIFYKVDMDYYTGYSGRQDSVRYRDFNESMIFSSPSNLIEQQVAYAKKQIEGLEEKIEKLESQLKSL